MIPVLSSHTLQLSDLSVSPADNSVLSLPPEKETKQLRLLFDNFYRAIKKDEDSISALYHGNAMISPDALLQTQLSLAKIHFREELLAKTVGKISQNIDMLTRSQ